jgi:ABC-type phosphate/phosphonate transport system substrate-binding protein
MYNCIIYLGLLKEKILQALLKMQQTRLWGSRLEKFGLLQFVPNNTDNYQQEREIQEAVKNMSLGTRYY